MQPRCLDFLSVMLISGTRLCTQAREGSFAPLDTRKFLAETFEILKRLDLKPPLFFANHASNYLPLTGRLPPGKVALIKRIDAALSGEVRIKPEFVRGLQGAHACRDTIPKARLTGLKWTVTFQVEWKRNGEKYNVNPLPA